MKHQDKFDEIINNKLNSQEFPFDEANWEKAAAMIDASRKGKNRAGFWIFSTLIVLTCGVIGFYTIGNVASNDTDTLAQSTEVAQKNAETMASSVLIPEAQNMEQTSPAPTENNSKTNAVSNETLKPETAVENTKASSPKNNISSSKALSKSVAESSSSQKQAEINLNKKPVTSVVKESDPNIVSQPDAVAKKSDPINESKTDNSPNTSPANTKQGQGVNDVAKNTASNKKVETKTDEPKVADTKAENNPTILPKLGEQTPTENANTAKLANAETAVASLDTTTKDAVKATKIDTASAAVAASKPEEPKLYKNMITAEAGADYLMGWQNPNSRDANGINPIIGINYSRFFTRHFGLSLGVQYNSVSHLNYSSHVSTDTHYAFGQENDVTVITPTKLHYVVAPFKVNYVINKANIIGVGCNVAYLMTVNNTVDTYNTRLNYVSDHHVSKTKGYVSGINPWDTQLSLFYTTSIYKDLRLNAEVLYGLNDVKDNSFFNSNVYERNVGFKLTLLLNLYKK